MIAHSVSMFETHTHTMYISHAHLFVKCVHAPLLPCVLNIIRARRVLAHLPFLAEMPVSPFCERTLDRAPGPCRGAVLPSTAYSPTACLSRRLQAPRGQPPCRRCSTGSQTSKGGARRAPSEQRASSPLPTPNTSHDQSWEGSLSPCRAILSQQ